MIAPRTTWDLQVRPTRPSGRYAWLEDLHSAHGPRLRHMLRRMLGNEEEALDVYQDCMYHLARRCEHTSLHSAEAYAYRTAANLATETLRRRKRYGDHWTRIVTDQRVRRRLHDTTSQDNAADDRQGALTRLRRAVRALPRHLRDVVVLRDLGELPYRQVARILGIRPTTARVYRRQAVIRLGDVFDATGPTS